MKCRVVRLQQGSKEWHAWREGGLGASDAASIMGVSPYVSAESLWKIRVGIRKRPESTFAMRRGHRLESKARHLYRERTAHVVWPACVESLETPWMRASLDGWNLGGHVVEIKCLKIEHHEMALAGEVPQHYVPQLQHQLYVTGSLSADYVSYSEESNVTDDDRLAIVTVPVDEAYIAELLAEEAEFWEMVQQKEWREHATRITA